MNFTDEKNAFAIVTVLTTAPVVIQLPNCRVMSILHMQVQADGVTPSGSNDYVVIMGSNVTIDPTFNDGDNKAIIWPSGAIEFSVENIPYSEIQIQAVGHSAKLMLIKGKYSR